MSNKHEQGGTDVRQKNVYQKPLHQHSSPRSLPGASKTLESSVKTGFCSSTIPIAATLTNSFLDFSATRGLDLRKQGIEPGQRICIEAARWKEALDGNIREVPKVKLDCTHENALETVEFDTLRKFRAPGDNDRVVWPGEQTTGGVAKMSKEIGGKEPRA